MLNLRKEYLLFVYCLFFEGEKIRSKKFILHTSKPKEIRIARALTKADYIGDCEKCEQYFDLLQKVPLSKESSLELKKLQHHQQVAQHQRITFQTQRDTLTGDKCIIVQVFVI